jgi:hypothetical protein
MTSKYFLPIRVLFDRPKARAALAKIAKVVPTTVLKIEITNPFTIA